MLVLPSLSRQQVNSIELTARFVFKSEFRLAEIT